MLGKVPIDVEDMKIDLMSLSGHKVKKRVCLWSLFLRRLRDLNLHS